jgi:hypothetical protein
MFNGPERYVREFMLKLFPMPDFMKPDAPPWVPPWEAWQPPTEPQQQKEADRPKPQQSHGESYYRDKLARELGGKIEVSVSGGRIDVLTRSEVIEVKAARAWKGALGQVLIYGKSYPQRRLRIHLFGELPLPLKEIQEHCRPFGVQVSWE